MGAKEKPGADPEASPKVASAEMRRKAGRGRGSRLARAEGAVECQRPPRNQTAGQDGPLSPLRIPETKIHGTRKGLHRDLVASWPFYVLHPY